MSMLNDLIAEIEKFIGTHEMSESGFGRAAMGDPNFLYDIRDRGRTVQVETLEHVRAFMRNYRKRRKRANA